MEAGTKWSPQQRRKFQQTMAQRRAEKAQGRDQAVPTEALAARRPPPVPVSMEDGIDELVDRLEEFSIHACAYVRRNPAIRERLLDAARILVEALA